MGDYKGVKTVFSGHINVLLLLRRKDKSRSNRKAQTRRGGSRETGKVVFYSYLKICSGWIENLKVPPR